MMRKASRLSSPLFRLRAASSSSSAAHWLPVGNHRQLFQQLSLNTARMLRASTPLSTLFSFSGSSSGDAFSPSWLTRFATHRDAARQRLSGSRGKSRQSGSWQRWRQWLESHDPDHVMYAILGTNIAVYIIWWAAEREYRTLGNPRWLLFMREHFICSWNNLTNKGHVWTLVTSAFSHSEFMHLLFNMFVLHSFAPAIMGLVGIRQFLNLYFGAAVLSSGVHVAFSRMMAPPASTSVQPFFNIWSANPNATRSTRDPYAYLPGVQGASGSLAAVTALFACVNPYATLLLYGIVPVPAAMLVGGMVLYDAYHVINPPRGNRVANLSHVVGAVTGAAFYALL